MVREFQKIYERKVWGAGSGPGSTPGAVVQYCRFIEDIIRSRKISAIVDFGCGYYAPYANLDWNRTSYCGIDVVEECIKANLSYAKPNRIFMSADWMSMIDLPQADLALCKDVMQHWPHSAICHGLHRLASYPLVLITNSIECDDVGVNSDIILGGFRPLNLLKSPYHLRPTQCQPYNVSNLGCIDRKLMLLWEPHRHPLPANFEYPAEGPKLV